MFIKKQITKKNQANKIIFYQKKNQSPSKKKHAHTHLKHKDRIRNSKQAKKKLKKGKKAHHTHNTPQ